MADKAVRRVIQVTVWLGEADHRYRVVAGEKPTDQPCQDVLSYDESGKATAVDVQFLGQILDALKSAFPNQNVDGIEL